jgi:L-threonylcarbamoyladenylate synthase
MTRTDFFSPFHPITTTNETGPLSTLRSGGLVLLPTANLWQMVADFRHRGAIQRLLSICRPSPVNHPELIFADHQALLSWFPRLHPKLDNLLLYHHRAVVIRVPATNRIPDALVDERDEVAVRLACDTFTYRLCEDQESPLVAMLGTPAPQAGLPTRFGRIRSDVLRAADYTVRRRQKEDIADEPIMTVRMESDELHFL